MLERVGQDSGCLTLQTGESSVELGLVSVRIEMLQLIDKHRHHLAGEVVIVGGELLFVDDLCEDGKGEGALTLVLLIGGEW